MIIFDTETTGLVQPQAMPLDKQPQIIEFAGIKLDPISMEEIARFEFMCNPGKPLPEKIIEITGITDDQLKDCVPFSAHFLELADFFLGEHIVVAHNLKFDIDMLNFELRRMSCEQRFPWPHRHHCTVEMTYDFKGKRLRLGDLHEMACGGPIEGAHRAMTDVEALVRIVKWLKAEKGMFQ